MSVWDGDTSQPEWERENHDWRGDQHANLAEQEGTEESWRGDMHLDEDWPEELAGPEYWLNKKRRNDGK